ncbi:MAG: tetratricopeptide repeat protein, partial [Chthoniobacterales bacterium]|nr:tetratricopeptide repeat protein [Chthoniobacterales bacterium]
VAIAYGVVAWLLIQIATQVFPFFEIPHWGVRMVILAIVFGFPLALIFAWAFELTPEGLKRTEEVDPTESITRSTGRKIDFVIIALLSAIIVGLLYLQFRSGDGLEKSIAVLPFENLSEEKANAYFADGIQEEILTRLAKISDLKVISRTSTQRYRSAPSNIPEIAKQLGVANILEGSVQKEADRVRVNVQLIDARTDRSRWAEAYDRKWADIIGLQSEIAQSVAEALDARLTGREKATLLAKPTESHAAYDAYLRGRFFLHKSPEKARVLFGQAISDDPRFALGYAGLADYYILLGKRGAMPGNGAAQLAWPQVEAALALDDQLAEGYISRGILLNDFEWNPPAAAADYRRSLKLSPNSADAHRWYARALGQSGRFEEALREIAAAEQQDPLSPLILVTKAKLLFVARKFEQALEPSRKALELEPEFAGAFSILAQSYSELGMHQPAMEAAARFVALSGDTGWAKLELAYACAAAGEKPQCERLIREATAVAGQFSPFDMATISSARHEFDAAFQWLERSVEERSVDVIWIRVDPRLDHIRADARFQKVLAQMVPRR